MSTAEVLRRITLFFAAAVLLIAALSLVDQNRPKADTLPAKLSDTDFWKMISDFSEDGGYFRSDNFLSNETGYQRVIPGLRKNIRPGGVYLGVGPEQNFTYITSLEPKIAFVVDIRRQNMIEHLMYKALMELSPDRAGFLSRLFARPRPASVDARSSPGALVTAYRSAQPSDDLFETNLGLILDHLRSAKRFEMSAEDKASVRYVYQAFFESGPDMSYTFLGGFRGFAGMPSYGDLMTENDGHTHNWSFLASEDQYRFVRQMQEKNLIVPLVGDFAGPKAIRSVGRYLKEHDAVLSVFYTSNVEQYLFQDVEDWQRFYSNVSTLPLDSSSTFIRYVLNSWGFSRRSRALTSSIPDVVRAYNGGRIRSYWDVVGLSR